MTSTTTTTEPVTVPDVVIDVGELPPPSASLDGLRVALRVHLDGHTLWDGPDGQAGTIPGTYRVIGW